MSTIRRRFCLGLVKITRASSTFRHLSLQVCMRDHAKLSSIMANRRHLCNAVSNTKMELQGNGEVNNEIFVESNPMENLSPSWDISLSRRYAMAILRSILCSPNLEETATDFLKDMECLKLVAKEKSHPFNAFLDSPMCKPKEKETFFESLLDVGFSPLTVRFLILLQEQKRFSFLQKILDAFDTLYKEYCAVLPCSVVTAKELTSTQKDKLLEALIQRYPGKKFDMQYNVQTGFMGGLMLHIGDETHNYSIASRVEDVVKHFCESTQTTGVIN